MFGREFDKRILKVILAYDKHKKAEIFLEAEEAKKTSIFKYYVSHEYKINRETLETSIEAIKKTFLNKKDITDVPDFKEYPINLVDSAILKDLMDSRLGKKISEIDNSSGKTGTVHELAKYTRNKNIGV